MNDSENNSTTKVIVGVIIAILVILVVIYVYKLVRNDNSVNDVKNDVNQVGQDVKNGTEDIVDGTSDMINDAANGISNTVNDIIDYTMTDNAMVENNIKTNTSEKIKDDKKFDTLTFKEVTLIGRDNATTFTAKIKNTSDTDFKSKNVTITFYKKDNTTITTTGLSIPDIKAGDTTEVTVTMAEDVANAYDYTVE